MRTVQALQNRVACLAMICKTAVARKLLNYIDTQKLNLAYCATHSIDAKRYFNAAVDASLLFCKFDLTQDRYVCDVYGSLEAETFYRMGYRNGTAVRDMLAFERLQALHNPKLGAKWRSGIKHDCSSVMELHKVNDHWVNGLGEMVELEETFLFPLVKGSDVARNRVDRVDRFVLVTQTSVGAPTEGIQALAPKTWRYLMSHADILDSRKSRIYQKNPRFSIFGVGAYTFSPWKIAIAGLYKKLNFCLMGEMRGKPIVFDDTVYFLSFKNEQAARETLALLTSPMAIEFYSSLIFWDEKRPIKASILNSLDLTALAAKLAETAQA